MIATETQATTPTVCHIGTQCELLLPPTFTSTPTKATVVIPKPIISDVSDDDDDDVDHEVDTTTDTTQSTLYEEATSASETESDLPVDKQKTHLIFE